MMTVIEMALHSGDDEWKILVRQVMKHFPDEFERFAELVRADERQKYKWDVHSCGPACKRYACVAMREAVEAEREAIMDEWWMCVQSDLENGVKSLNERAAEKWKKEYPAIAGFARAVEARSNT